MEYRAGNRRYPVVYMQDGQNVFDAATSFAREWGVDETLDSLRAGAIVVALDNGDSHGLSEYNPWTAADPTLGGGEGRQNVSFQAKTLKPYTDAHYRTLADPVHTGIIGSSMGGLIALYAVLARPDVLGRGGVFSCACWIARKDVYAFARHAGKSRAGARLNFVVGALETNDGEPARDLRDMVDTLLSAGRRRDVNVRAVMRRMERTVSGSGDASFPPRSGGCFHRP